MAKIVKLKVIKPTHVSKDKSKPIDWSGFGQIIKDIDYNVYRIKNKTITEYHQYMQKELEFSKQFFNKHQKYPNTSDYKKFRKKNYNGLSYHKMIKTTILSGFEDADMAKEILNNSIKEAIEAYDKNKKDIRSGIAIAPTFKRHQPFLIAGRDIVIDPIDKDIISVPLICRTGMNHYSEYNFKRSGHIAFKVASKNNHAKIALDRIISGRYKICDSHMFYDGKSCFLQLCFKDTEVKQVAVDKNKILGLDLGISKAVTMQVDDTKKHDFIEGGEITAFRNRINAQRKSIQNQLKYCSDNRHGHGRKTLLRPLDKLESKIENFKETTNHRYSKYIVDYAIKNGCGTIQMELLTDIAKDDAFLKTWSYFDLQTKIEYKAKDVGIIVKYIKPDFTSQRCNHCGIIDKESRVTQDKFKCTNCGHTTNADLNAARNIAMPNIESIIKDQLELQKKLK